MVNGIGPNGGLIPPPHTYKQLGMDPVSKLRQQDASMQHQIQKAKAGAGGAHVNVQVQTTRGPDGQTYVTGYTVTTTQRVDSRTGEQANTLAGSLKDLGAPEISMSPLDFARMMAEENRTSMESIALAKLRAADMGVRGHEAQHFRAGGGLVSGTPQYETVTGPDGSQYAVGGYVNIGTTGGGDADKAARDAVTFANAATAPGDASAQDIAVARDAYSRAAFNALTYNDEQRVDMAV